SAVRQSDSVSQEARGVVLRAGSDVFSGRRVVPADRREVVSALVVTTISAMRLIPHDADLSRVRDARLGFHGVTEVGQVGRFDGSSCERAGFGLDHRFGIALSNLRAR